MRINPGTPASMAARSKARDRVVRARENGGTQYLQRLQLRHGIQVIQPGITRQATINADMPQVYNFRGFKFRRVA